MLASSEEDALTEDDAELIQQARQAFARDYGYLEKVLKEASRALARQNRTIEDD